MKKIKYLIIGAGISGLTVGNELLEQGVEKEEILILEKNDYVGGLIKTDHVDGYLSEFGPEGLRGGKPSTERIFDYINEEPVPVSSESKIRYIGKNGEIVRVPSGPLKAVTTPLLSFTGKLRILKEPFVSKKVEDEPIAEFVERRLGKQVVPLVDAFVTGVFGGNPYKLSTQYAFPALKDIERQFGNLIPGGMKYAKQKKENSPGNGKEDQNKKKAPFLVTLSDGMQGLCQKLADNLNVELLKPVSKLQLGSSIQVTTTNEVIEAENVIVSTGINALQHIEIIDDTKAYESPVITEANVLVVSLGFDHDSFDKKVEGYGFLIPDSENRFLMGTLFSSNLFDFRAPDDKIMLRCFVGGIRHPDRLDLSNEEILDNVLSDLDDYLGLNKQPTFVNFQTHQPRGIPQLMMDHEIFQDWRNSIESLYSNIKFNGIGWQGISCEKLIDESIEIARELVIQ